MLARPEPPPSKAPAKALPPPARLDPSNETERDELEGQLQTLFGDNTARIIDFIEADQSDTATTLLYKSLLQSLVSLVGVTEGNIIKTKGAKGVHGFSIIVSQLRELMADIQASKDRSLIGVRVVESQVRPAFLNVAMQIKIAFGTLQQRGQLLMEKENFAVYSKEITDMEKDLARYLMAQYEATAKGVAESLD